MQAAALRLNDEAIFRQFYHSEILPDLTLTFMILY